VQLSLSGLAKQAGQYHVHVTPIAGGVASGQECSGASVGGHFNPRGGTLPCDPLAPSKCEVGDLSGKHGNFSELETVSTSYSDDSIVLSGVETVVGRSIVIHKNDATNSRWVCADIKWKDPAAAPTAAPTFAPTAVPSLSPGSAPHLRGCGLWMARIVACRGRAHEWLAAHCGTRCVQVRAT
jgi:hypothetical protein